MMTQPKPEEYLYKVVRMGEDGPETDALTSTWTGYLNGHWTKEKPKRPGRYQIADREGHTAGVLVFYRDPAGNVRSATEWEGWFWSFPLPPTPPTVPPREWGSDHPHLTVVK